MGPENELLVTVLTHGACTVFLGLMTLPRPRLQRGAEQRVRRLVEAGWHPPAAVHEAAVRQVVEELRITHLSGLVAGVGGLTVFLLAGAPPFAAGWGFWWALLIGTVVGQVVGHVRAGRFTTGRRVASTRSRGFWAGLPRQDRIASVLHLAVTATAAWVLLGPVRQAQGVPGGTTGWVIVGAFVLSVPLVLALGGWLARRATSASSLDALRWQDASRGVLLRDVARLLGGSSLGVALAPWALSPDPPASAWVAGLLAGLGAIAVTALVLPTFGRPSVEPATPVAVAA